MTTRRPTVTRRLEDKLDLALRELKLSKTQCEQLLMEREDSEKEVINVIEQNTKLKSEMAGMHAQFIDILAQRDRLQRTVDTFDRDSGALEVALQRTSVLEVELRDAYKLISTLENAQTENKSIRRQSLFEELVESVPDMVPAISPVNTHPTVTVDLTGDESVCSTTRNTHLFSTLCGGRCCGRRREGALRAAVGERLAGRAASAARPLADLLLSTKASLQEHLTALSQQSQNKTALIFGQVYRSQASRTHAALASLYEDIRVVLLSGTGGGEEIGAPPPRDLAAASRRFFREVFPVAYHNVLKLENQQFTPEYEACLRDAYEAVQPFGQVPRQLGTTLSRSLEAARALLQALALGAAALASAEQLVGKQDICTNALTRVAVCARCRGLDARPCRNYCLNVVRGCIGASISELDAPWAAYVEGVEKAARGEVDAALRGLDSRISEAIMHALENQSTMESKVRQECGPHSTTPLVVSLPAAAGAGAGAGRRGSLRAPPPDTELLQFAAQLAGGKRLFARLADRLCDEPEMAHPSNEQCWTGERVGEYTKPLVASSSLSDQRYNPEVSGVASLPRVAALADQLRHARQVLVSHSWGGAPSAEAFMQGDDAGAERDAGSGSGRSYDDSPDYDNEGSGDASGDGPDDSRIKQAPVETSTQRTDDGASLLPSACLAFTTMVLLYAT